MKKIQDVGSRALKTFVQAFFGSLVPEICAILMNISAGTPIEQLQWDKWYIYAIPVVSGALSAGISAAWNTVLNALSKDK